MAIDVEVEPESELESTPSPIDSVALYGGGDRQWTIREPLETVGVTVTTDGLADATIALNPGTTLCKRLLDRSAGPLVYRLRGDYWRVLRERPGSWLRATLADRVFARVDACLTPDERLDATWRDRTGGTTTGVVGLPIDADAWPTRTHQHGSLRCLTLGNFDYWAKTSPVLDWLPYVNDVLRSRDGIWGIAGDGRYSPRLARAVEPYSRIDYLGYVDAADALAETDVLLHPSAADIAYPNAILEAFASRIPAVVPPTAPFEANDHVCVSRPGSLRTLFELLGDPTARAVLGERGRRYVERAHAPATIGDQLREFLAALVRLEHHFP